MPALTVGEGEEFIITYTSAVDKMKVFSAFISEGLESGDLVDYSYPDEESETVRAKLKEYGIDVEKYEREGNLILDSLTEYYTPDGKFDKDRLVNKGLNDRAEAKRKGYKHYRSLDDLGDFSFLNGQWQTYIDYWDDPAWETPSGTGRDMLDYSPFVTELTAFSIEGIDEPQLAEMLKAFWVGHPTYTVFIDLLEHADAFSKLLHMRHQEVIGRKILLEFNPVSDYERVVDSLAKETIANIEPFFVFTSRTSSIRTYLAKHPAVRFFLTSISTSAPKSTSENEMLLPAGNASLLLDALGKVLETHVDVKGCLVFDILSELLTSIGLEKTLVFLHNVLDMLYSGKITGLFLLNTSAHEPEVISAIRGLFRDLLTYDRDRLKVKKIS
ncbi:MAG: MEDS domain-containing protein [Candidatus Bathyarchaeia archaeon]